MERGKKEEILGEEREYECYWKGKKGERRGEGEEWYVCPPCNSLLPAYLCLFPLQEVSMSIVSRPVCESALRNTRLGPRYVLHPGMICAGGEAGKDACKVRVSYYCVLCLLLLTLSCFQSF